MLRRTSDAVRCNFGIAWLFYLMLGGVLGIYYFPNIIGDAQSHTKLSQTNKNPAPQQNQQASTAPSSLASPAPQQDQQASTAPNSASVPVAVNPEDMANLLDRKAVERAFLQASSLEDFEHKVNEIYLGPDVICVFVENAGPDKQAVTLYIDNNPANGKMDPSEKIMTLTRNSVDTAKQQVQYSTTGYGPYGYYTHPPIYYAMGLYATAWIMHAVLYPRPFYYTPFSRITAISQTRTIYRSSPAYQSRVTSSRSFSNSARSGSVNKSLGNSSSSRSFSGQNQNRSSNWGSQAKSGSWSGGSRSASPSTRSGSRSFGSSSFGRSSGGRRR